MKEIQVNEVMVPLNEYATVRDDASLYEAIIELENAQKSYLQSYEPNIYPHRAIIVIDKDNKVVGKISQLDILQSLEPRYRNLSASEDIARTSESGFSRDFLQSMVKQYGLYEHTLSYLCQKAAKVKATEIMYSISKGEVFVKQNDTLQIAVHQLVIGQHQSLLVTDDHKDNIVGVLRLTDVFKLICDEIKSCSL